MRYVDQHRARIVAENVPAELRHLLLLATKWAIVGESKSLYQIDHASIEELREFVMAFQPALAAIRAFCLGPESERVPVPDEAVLFQLALHAYEEAEPVLRLKSRTPGSR